jgi:hypothetical protein
MIHPMWGDLVVCSEHDGRQHPTWHVVYVDHCYDCGRQLLACTECRQNVACCPCAMAHSAECDWPL